VILRRLMRGPTTRDELIGAVIHSEGEDAYSQDAGARLKAFENDRKNLRHRLGVQFSYKPAEGVYQLNDSGPYGYIELSPQGLSALRILSETFAGAMGEVPNIQRLIEEITGRLSPEAQRILESGTQPIDVDIYQDVDPVAICPRVWETTRKAVTSRRKLTFNYLSPSHADRLPRYHEVAPYRLRYKRGHWYLYAYSLKWLNPHGKQNWEQQHLNYRLQYILDDDKLQILPQVVAQAPRSAPRFRLHYRLAPPVGRGHISRHFDDMEIEQDPEAGWAEIRATSDDLFEAARTLLAYGENCIVLGGPKLLALVRQKVEGMAGNYGIK